MQSVLNCSRGKVLVGLTRASFLGHHAYISPHKYTITGVIRVLTIKVSTSRAVIRKNAYWRWGAQRGGYRRAVLKKRKKRVEGKGD